MIFNTFTYYFIFLIPAALVFRVAGGAVRPWVCVASGVGFFVYYSAIQFGGWWGVACVLIFFWEALFRYLYYPGARACILGILISIGVLGIFKYWNFLTGSITEPFSVPQSRLSRCLLPNNTGCDFTTARRGWSTGTI